jgi:hypothetical protein
MHTVLLLQVAPAVTPYQTARDKQYTPAHCLLLLLLLLCM